MIRRNQIVVSIGRKGSGKSQLLWDLFTSQAPRVLSLDNLGESKERDRDAVEVVGWSQLVQAFRAASRFQRWHIVASLEPADMKTLFTMICPPLGSNQPSLSVAFGGMAIVSNEAYDVAPNGRTAPEILAAWRRGRHYQLDLYMATQRPAAVAREVTALADLVFCFAQREPVDIDFLGKHISPSVAVQVRDLRPENYQCVRYDSRDGTVALLDRNRRLVGRSADVVAVG